MLGGIGLLLLDGSGAEPIERGSPAPAFELPALEGEPVSLGAYAGRVVLVNFWATWCKPCEEEMPAMERLYQAHREAGFELLAIAVGEPEEVVRPFRDRLGLTFPVLLDEDKRVSLSYQTFRFPESYLIGPDGRVVERYVGPRVWDSTAYVERVGRLIAEGDIR